MRVKSLDETVRCRDVTRRVMTSQTGRDVGRETMRRVVKIIYMFFVLFFQKWINSSQIGIEVMYAGSDVSSGVVGTRAAN